MMTDLNEKEFIKKAKAEYPEGVIFISPYVKRSIERGADVKNETSISTGNFNVNNGDIYTHGMAVYSGKFNEWAEIILNPQEKLEIARKIIYKD